MATLFVLFIVFICIVAVLRLRNFLRYRSKKRMVRNKFTRMIEDTSECGFGSRPYEPFLKIQYPLYDQPLVIQRQLSIREFCRLKKERYADKRGWRLSPYAYTLNNTCSKCGRSLYAIYQSSPQDTWAHLCGRAGILVYCPHCHADLNFFLTLMN